MLPAQYRWIAAGVLAALLTGGTTSWAQRGSGLQRGAGTLFRFRPATALDLLARGDVKRELELVDDQLKAVDQLRQQLRDRRREFFAELRESGDRSGARERIQSEWQQSNREIRAALERILLPHQFTRLNQLQVQQHLRSGVLAALNSPQLRERLEMTDEQRQELRQKSREVERELRERVTQWMREAQTKLLALLTPQQRATFDEMVGEPFEFQDERRRAGRTQGGPRVPANAPPPAETP